MFPLVTLLLTLKYGLLRRRAIGSRTEASPKRVLPGEFRLPSMLHSAAMEVGCGGWVAMVAQCSTTVGVDKTVMCRCHLMMNAVLKLTRVVSLLGEHGGGRARWRPSIHLFIQHLLS